MEQLSMFETIADCGQPKGEDITFFSAQQLKEECIEGYHWYQEYILLMQTDTEGNEFPEYWWKKSDLALLEGNKVYYKEPFSYPFMQIFKSEKAAKKFYLEKLTLLNGQYVLSEPPYRKGSIVKVEKNEDCFFEDMHQCKEQDRYSCYEYADKQRYGYRPTIQ